MKKKVLNIVLVLVSLILLEVFSQSFIFFYEKKYSIFLKPFLNILINPKVTNYEIQWDYKKNKIKPGKYKNQFTSYTINSMGFRGSEFNFKKKNNTTRIITFGGSTTIGLESPDNKTYPYLLEQKLNQSQIGNFEVFNMGLPSKSLNFIKNLFLTEAYKYDPDVIIIYSNRNSIMYDGGSTEPFFDKIKNQKIIQINYFLQENIMTYRLLYKFLKKIKNLNLKSEYLFSPFNNKGISYEYLINGYKNSLIEIINFSKSKEIKTILVKQAYYFEPNIIDEINKFSNEELIKLYKEKFFIKKYNLSEEDNFWIIFGSILNKNLDFFINYDNVIIVDPIKNLLTSKQNFTDYLHLTPEGNTILANEIFSSIINNLKKFKN